MKIAVYGTEIHEENIPVYHRIFDFFEKNGISYFVEKKIITLLTSNYGFNFEDKQLFQNILIVGEQFDLLLSIGGDGTFLSAVPIAIDRDIPIAGINCGRLGFLADINSDEIESALTMIINGEFKIEKRSLVEIIQPFQLFEGSNYAANELTVHKLDNSSMIKIETYINHEFLTNYWADGLIVATPTGSTAYSLSVGGPILMPLLTGLIITPIASHNLTMRPIVVPDNVEIELRIEGRGNQFRVSIDHRSMPLDFATVLKIKKAEVSIKVVKITGQSFNSTLRNKLMWGADKRN
jgi:NAD+ kinase